MQSILQEHMGFENKLLGHHIFFKKVVDRFWNSQLAVYD